MRFQIPDSIKFGFYPDGRRPHETTYAYGKEKSSFKTLKALHPDSYRYWKSNPFTYRMNSWGHRGDEPTEGGAVFLGCSYTWGWGMREDWSWPWLVGAELGLPVTNLGYPGEGGDRAALLALAWIEQLKPARVFWLDIFNTRRTWLIDWDKGEAQSMNHDAPEAKKPEYRILHKIACSPGQEWFDIERNCATVERVCNRVGAKLVRCGYEDYAWVSDHPSRQRDQELYSRDGGNHPSREEQALIAEWMLNQV